MYVCVYVCMYVRTYVCTCVWLRMCVCVCMHVYVGQCCTISERQAAVVSHLCTVVPIPVPVPVPNICRSTVWNVRHVVFLAPRNLRWLLDFWKLCAILVYLYVCTCISPTSQLHLSSLMYFPPLLIHRFQMFLTFLQEALQLLFQYRPQAPQRIFSSPLA